MRACVYIEKPFAPRLLGYMQQSLASSLDFYNDSTKTSHQNLLLRVTNSKPFIVEDLIAAHTTKSPRITFRPNRKSRESEEARKYALSLPVGTAFVACVILDSEYKRNREIDRDTLWMAFLVSQPEIVLDWVNAVKLHFAQLGPPMIPSMGLSKDTNPQNGVQNSAKSRESTLPPGAGADVWAELQSLKLRMSDQEQKYNRKIHDLECEVSDLRQENKRLASRLKGVGFLIDRRTDDMKQWVNGLLKR